jgi:Asp-tRNA(Asn)/Glu-tRNA(Gln) amidotransferase B subunit
VGGRESAEIVQNRVGTDEQRQKLTSQESELRNIIKEVLREEREEFARLRQRERREMEEMFERLMDIFAAKSTADPERLDSKLTDRLEGETGKLVQKISSFQVETY